MTAPCPLSPETALFLDVDGTLLDIAPHPEQVSVSPELPALLQRLAAERQGALALISGRRIADLDRLFQPWRGAAAGLHGVERRNADGTRTPPVLSDPDRIAATALNRVRPELAAVARQWPGAWLEDKERTLALHYRAAPEAGAAIRDAAQRLLREQGDGLRLILGKMVVEFQPRHHDKGRVIAAFMADSPFHGRVPVFLGDDTTDEDGFAEVNRRGGVSIRVGPRSGETAAVRELPSVRSVLEWLSCGRTPSAI
ncbi:MAG: trehalose-phosphatase [Alphaproteobacteria bacterium]|nr:trehalose-phosphatase [Alphaproteobacteria bacterium]MBV9966394.1 trehalose-phosphatase [Alphaproteobacteria bacterium]